MSVFAFLAGVWVLTATADPVSLKAVPFEGLPDGGLRTGCLHLDNAATLSAPRPFGGISGLSVDGDQALLLADDATIWKGEVSRGHDAEITGFSPLTPRAIHGPEGRRLTKLAGDSEALLTDGEDLLVSFERDHRVSRIIRNGNSWRETSVLFRPELPSQAANRGIEAMARHQLSGDAVITAIAEHVAQDGEAPLFVLSPDGEELFRAGYVPANDFAVTDMAIDPATNDLIVLERAFSRFRGPRARLTRVPVKDLSPGSAIIPEPLGTLTWLHGIDNMEALIAARSTSGTLRLYLLSDDNFRDTQRTVLMSLRVLENCSSTSP